jgi:hypothetical protein
MFQDEAAEHAIEGGGAQRQRVGKVVTHESNPLGTRLGSRASEHRLGEIESDDASAARREPDRMASGAAPDVDHGQPANVADERVDLGLFEGEKRVSVDVVVLGPQVVPFSRRKDERGRVLLIHGDATSGGVEI